MSFNSEKSPPKLKRLKQLSIFEVFGKNSKKRKFSGDKHSSTSEQNKRVSMGDSRSDVKHSQQRLEKPEASKANDEAQKGESDIIVVDCDVTDAVCQLPKKEGEIEQTNKRNIIQMDKVHLTSSEKLTYENKFNEESHCGFPIPSSDEGTELCRNTDLKHTTNEMSTEENKDEIKKVEGNGATSIKVYQKLFASKHKDGTRNREKIVAESCSERPKDSQEKDELYERIMQEKREANQRVLNTDIKEDSDISQETPPRPELPADAVVDNSPNPEVMNMYDSPDMFDTFPTQDFEDDFPEEKVEITWMGKPKSRLRLAPDCLLPLPQLEETKNHTVLFDISYYDIGPPPPSRHVYMDAWDSNHVKLPCSPKNLYPTGQGKKLTDRWSLIENALYSNITDSDKLQAAIEQYNSRFTTPFKALHHLFKEVLTPSETDNFFTVTLPKMIDLALSLPHLVTQPVPLLKKQKPHCVTLSQQQIACLLANAFFCTFPRRNSTGKNSEYASYPSINFSRLYINPALSRTQAHMEKLKTLLHYFKRVTEDMPSGVVTFERRVCQDFPVWNRSPCQLCDLHIRKDGLIEDDGKGMLQMDFANKYVGGGVLGGGMVQEEILFCIFPELIVSRLFTEVLDDNECLLITGAERFSSYSGYAETYKWEGDCLDPNSRDSWRRKTSYTLALDATSFSKTTEQYRPGNIRRELNKLYCGFCVETDPDYTPAIATGNWGCGAFGGDPVLKALLQLMAAAVTGRELCYFTFNDDSLMKTIHEMYEFISSSDLHVGDLWNTISKYNQEEVTMSVKQKRPVVENIFEFMKRIHREYDTSTDDGGNSPEKMSEEW